MPPASRLADALTAGAARLPAGAAALALAAVLALAGCIVVPRTADVYDARCRTYVKQVVLETEVIGGLGHCHNDGCAVMLASLGLISAASVVVSGSVAIVGNIAYWVERQGQCPAAPPGAASAPTVARLP